MRGLLGRRCLLLLGLLVAAMLLTSLAFNSAVWRRGSLASVDGGVRSEGGPTDPPTPSPLTALVKANSPPPQDDWARRPSGGSSSHAVAINNTLTHGGQPAALTKAEVKAAPDQWSFPASAAELFSTHDVSGESPALLDDLYRRVAKVEEACHSQRLSGTKVTGKVTGIFTHDASRVAYCFLPKVGCTFWIRVFSYLHNFTRDAVSSPWQIPRLKVHNTRHSHGVAWTPALHGQVADYLRFLFVRHPYSRLWSAYVDKLFLPDFWREIGVPAVRQIRRQKATQQAKRCGNDLSFPEFVEFSLTKYEPHWEPIHLRCDPCQFRPTVVGSMSTFSNDSLFLLRRMGLEWVLKDVDRQGQVENELSTLVRYNFQLTGSRAFFRPCLNHSSLTARLWKAFQINGYIPDAAPLPPLPAPPLHGGGQEATARWFESRVLEAFRAAMPRKKELKHQKQGHLHQALAALSPELKAKVNTKYKLDKHRTCVTKYSCDPMDVFVACVQYVCSDFEDMDACAAVAGGIDMCRNFKNGNLTGRVAASECYKEFFHIDADYEDKKEET